MAMIARSLSSDKPFDLDSLLEHSTPVRRIVARRVVSSAAFLNHSRGDLIRAKELHGHALELARSVGAHIATELSNLAHVSLLLNDTASAEKFLAEALATAGQRDMAWINYERAALAVQKGELQEARHLCAFAQEQLSRLGYKRGVQECQELFAHLHQ